MKKTMKFNWKDELVRMVLVITGAIGIMGTLIMCALGDEFLLPSIITIVLASMYAMIIRHNKMAKIIGTIAVFVVIGVIVLVSWKEVYKGVLLIIDGVLDTLSKPYNLNLPRFASDELAKTGVRGMGIVIVMLSAVVTLFVTGIVMNLSGFIAGIATTSPFLILFISCGVIPNVTIMLVCILFSFGMMAKRNKRKASAQIAITLMVGAVAIIISATVVKSEGYIRPQFIETGSDILKSDFNIEMGNVMTGQTGLGDGLLGRFDKLQYTGKEIMKVTVPSLGKAQYFPQNVGYVYSPYQNAWDTKKYNLTKDESDVVVSRIYADDERVKNYIDGGDGDFNNLVKFYSVSAFASADEGDTYERNRVDIDPSLYITFENVFNSYNIIAAKKNSAFTNIHNIMSSQKNSAQLASNKVSNTAKSTVEDIMGKRVVQSLQDELDYINEIKEYLDGDFRYTLSPGRVPEDKDFLNYFLTESKRGYCSYFATAATVMLQAAGVSARYVEGYVIDDSDLRKNGVKENDTYYTYSVTDRAAHAWVEVYINGIGWVPMEFTPSTMNNTNVGGQNVAVQVQPDAPNDYAQEVAASQLATENQTQETESKQEIPTEVDNSDSPAQKTPWVMPEWVKNVIVAALVMALCIAILVLFVKNYRKRIKDMRDDGDVIGLYTVLERKLKLGRMSKPDDMEYEEYAKYLENKSPIFRNKDFTWVMEIVLTCRFASEEMVDSEDRKKAAEQLFAILQAFRVRLSRGHAGQVR